MMTIDSENKDENSGSSTLASLVLETLERDSVIPNSDVLKWPNTNTSISFEAMQSACLSLAAREVLKIEKVEQKSWKLTEEGDEILNHGSHEARLFDFVVKKMGKVQISDIKAEFKDLANIAQGKALKNGWIGKDGDAFIAKTDSIIDLTRTQLQSINEGREDSLDSAALNDLKKRKLIVPFVVKSFKIEKGPNFGVQLKTQYTDLTAEMITQKTWQNAEFKQYNFEANGQDIVSGALHPLTKMRTALRELFLQMGFVEMPTNQFVESCFWNFDTLFVPQKHAARDLQDTFYLSHPAKTHILPDEKYVRKVQQAHESGIDSSIGYRTPWSKEEAQKLVLRTHTTPVSASMLYQIANMPGGPKPIKMFSIDRVFRNEALDATHLAEFHQVEGVILDQDITLGHLLGFMETFFGRLGVKNLRFKPAYNPYTEPSLEIFSYHEGLKKWVEIGNSGIFRPEMLVPMGLPSNYKAIGWGLSLERPTMIKYNISDIRSLLGPKVDLELIKKNVAVRLDKGLATASAAAAAAS